MLRLDAQTTSLEHGTGLRSSTPNSDNKRESRPLATSIAMTILGNYAESVAPKPQRPLVDRKTNIRWATLAPRFGEFSVDSANWFDELKRSPFYGGWLLSQITF